MLPTLHVPHKDIFMTPETVNVIRKSDGAACIINRDDYNKDQEAYEVAGEPESTATGNSAEYVSTGTVPTREEVIAAGYTPEAADKIVAAETAKAEAAAAEAKEKADAEAAAKAAEGAGSVSGDAGSGAAGSGAASGDAGTQ